MPRGGVQMRGQQGQRILGATGRDRIGGQLRGDIGPVQRGVRRFAEEPLRQNEMVLCGLPLWQLRESSELIYWVSVFNPFTHLIEIIRFGMHGTAMTSSGWIGLAILVVITPAAGHLFRPEAH